MVDQLSSFADEVTRVAREVGTEGRLGGQADVRGVAGTWRALTDSVNTMASNLTNQVRSISSAATAIAEGDLSRKITVSARGEVAELAETINSLTDTLRLFADEVTRVAREVGTEGRLGGQAVVPDVAGTWKNLTDAVNLMAANLTGQVRGIAQVATAVARGDLSQKITVDARGEILELKSTVNTMVDQLSSFADEVTRVAREVGIEGQLGGQAQVPNVSGTWRDLTENVNQLASNLTGQVRNIAQVTTAVARGDLSQKITVDARGEILELKSTVNTMVDQLSSFADEVTRVAREVGTEGKLGGQAQVPNVSGTWRNLTDNVNYMAFNLTGQVRNIAQVTTAVARGDLSQKITVDARGEILELKSTVNTMVDQLSSFADEVTRVAREVGTDGKLGGQAQVRGVSGTWRDLTENVNQLASNLTGQVRNIAQVTTAVARGDLSQKITVDARGEILELKSTVNTMVDQLSSFADEVTRVAREVGTDGKLGGQAQVKGVAGTWRDLTENVNQLASNLTGQVRNIAQVTTAVARGDLSQKITVDARGEILELKSTVNTMVDQLSSFAAEVTRVAREVGTEGKLGGQAQVRGVSGTWRDLTENVNQLAGTLTTQLRAISAVSTAVARGDLTQQIQVAALGEVAELKDNINQMIAALRETTAENAEQGWLDSNLARIGGLLQGQRDLGDVGQMIMQEVAPLVGAQVGTFFLAADPGDLADASAPACWVMCAGYAVPLQDPPQEYRFGEGLVGQAAMSKQSIVVTELPLGYLDVRSGTGTAAAGAIVVLPVLFEGESLGVIELGCDHAVLGAAPDLPGAAGHHDRRGARDHPGRPAHRAAARAVPAADHGTAGPVRRAAAHQRRAGGEGAAALRAEPQRRAQEHGDRRGTARRRGEGAAARAGQPVQVGVPGEHEPRAAHPAQLAAAAVAAARRQPGLEPDPEADRVRQDDPRIRVGAAAPDRGHPRPLQDRGRPGGHRARSRWSSPRCAPSWSRRSACRPRTRAWSCASRRRRSCPRSITTDAQRLQQILRNLLANAIKFTDAGSVTLQVGLAPPGTLHGVPSLDGARSVVTFAVRDTGIGIPGDKLAMIFEAFQQADGTTSRKYGGTGLGLSISKELAGLLGGKIEVSSEPGAGSVFTLLLPDECPGDDLGGVRCPGPAPGRSAAGSRRAGRAHPAGRVAVDGASGAGPVRDHGAHRRRRRAQRLRPHQRAGDARPRGPLRRQRPRRHRPAHRAPGGPDRADGRDDARPRRQRDHPPDPGAPAVAGPADRVPDGEGDARRPGVQPGRGRHRLRHQARRPRRAARDHGVVGDRQRECDGPRRRPCGMTTPVRVLAVDDRRENLLALQAILEGLPIEVVPVTSGEDALKQLLVKDYALILLDARMPGMDGFETAKHVKQRERTRHIPILFLTAADYDPHMAFRGYQAGAVDYITKPFDPWVLRSKVAVFVDLYLLHTEVAERAAERDALRKSVDEALALLDAAEPADAATSTLVERLRGALGALRHDQPW